jgi:KaiC/GvpD/RAD55 family RecA-like ATPase
MYDLTPHSPDDTDTNGHTSGVSGDPTNHDNFPGKKKLPIKKNSFGHLPNEILKFVKNESYSLLVKGKPGAGKTTFALTLMDNLNHDSNYFYISTRLSIKQLLFFFPWIDKFISKNDSKYEYKFEDARLDEPESLFERITNQLMDVKSPIIIIDTWDAIASFMDKESRLNNERVLQIWRERAGAKLIFLSESCETTLLDSIVDGVITLKNEFEKSNEYRELYINKLRGISINCSRYYFSLFNGLFFVLDSLNELSLFEKLKINEFPVNRFGYNKNKLFYKHASSNYQKNKNNFFMNLLRNNKLITMEFGSGLHNEMILSIMLSPLLYWINYGNFILTNNFEWNFYSMLKKIMLYFIQPDVLANNLLNEKLDLPDIFKNDDINYEHDKHFMEQKGGSENFSDSINKILSQIQINHNKKNIHNNILNIVDGNNSSHLISNFGFVNTLKQSQLNNLIVLKKNSSIDNDVLLSESNYYKVFLKGKNILIKSVNPSKYVFGALNENDSLLIDWCPMY